ncbi:MAG: NUDIX domain-containing protein [Spirochaetes bacterium]|nr:NUDIX domain-containing protein [Spirochaetota bacterium]
MEMLKEFLVKDGININGNAIYREAVRAVIRNGGNCLMVLSKKNGDYKFPGGGINDGEDHESTLRRELREECGIQMLEIIAGYGKVIEYDRPKEREYDVFKMTSYYYLCSSDTAFGQQNLDDYEKALGFTPVWISLDAALANNKQRLEESPETMPRWVKRDTYILERLKNEYGAQVS